MGEKVFRLQRNKKDTDLVSKFLKQCTLKRFSKYIYYHISRGHMIGINFFLYYSIGNEEVFYGDVPCFVAY